jgi:hypothetical protein
MLVKNIEIPTDKIADFCQRWKITELALFGSVLRDDFRLVIYGGEEEGYIYSGEFDRM